MTDEDHAQHAAYVAELKASGEYLKPEELIVSWVYNPRYDDAKLSPKPLESARMEFLDFGK